MKRLLALLAAVLVLGLVAGFLAPASAQPYNSKGLPAWDSTVDATRVLQAHRTTYTAAVNSLIPTADGDILIVRGSATRTVRILRVVVSGILTTGDNGSVVVLRSSTAASGGTSAAVTPAKHDTASAAATATATSYTVPPTPGTFVAVLATRRAFFSANTAAGAPALIEFHPGEGMVLRGTSDWASVRLSSFDSYAGAIVNVEVTWTEE